MAHGRGAHSHAAASLSRAVAPTTERDDLGPHRYRGPLLPRSEAPGIVRRREYIDAVLRTAVLSGSRPEHACLVRRHRPDDIEIHEHALRLPAPGDSRRAPVTARLPTALTI
ncbi:hypothetical protein [Nocardia sp. CC227C]|uniref:hypothetical protein n=1 Tax=Nocardia sp. CC227C TaxID=3044562 RepID=UPI00278BE0DF|nr:hypothetical protein [Nocardia sp. CC227C]